MFSKRFFCIAVLLFSFVGTITGCGGGSSSSKISLSISGVVQKGPLREGSTVNIQPLLENGNPNVDKVEDTTLNQTSLYEATVNWSGFTLIEATGQYISEITGETSTNSVTLCATPKISPENLSININLFTHLVCQRQRALMATGKSYDESYSTAIEELKNSFGLSFPNENAFWQLDIYSDNESLLAANSTLLLFSAAVAKSNHVLTLQSITDDFLDESSRVDVLSKLAAAAATIDISALQAPDGLNYLGGASVPEGAPSWIALAENQAPQLLPIENTTFQLGETLELILASFDYNDDTLRYSAVGLPNNSGISSTSGNFSFKPTELEVGDHKIQFMVSDGILTSSQEITITVLTPNSEITTSLSGRVLDTNDFVFNQKETPVVGAVISLLGTEYSTTTDRDGKFELMDVPSGNQVFDINPASANTAPDGSGYAGFREKFHILANVQNIVSRPFYVPRLEQASIVEVDPNATTMVINERLNISVEIPAHTAKTSDGSDYAGPISIAEVPEGLAPAAMPDKFNPGLLITLQPIGVEFSQPVPITFPNTDNLPADSETDIWSLDPHEGVFVVVGKGKVTEDGNAIETITGGVRATDWHFLSPLLPELLGSNNDNQGPLDCTSTYPTASATKLCTGALIENHKIVAYKSQQQWRSLNLIYDSSRANPRPIISVDATIPVRSAVPKMISASLMVANVEQDVLYFTDTGTLSENEDETVRTEFQFDAIDFVTGLYSYEATLTNYFEDSTFDVVIVDDLLVYNQANSSIGSGWGISGVSRLYPQDNEKLLLADGSGSAIVFDPLIAENGLRSRFYDGFDIESGFANNNAKSFQVTRQVGVNTFVEEVNEFTLPVINFLDSRLDRFSFFNAGSNNEIDVGSTANFPQGDDISIQPPGGMSNFGASFEGFLDVPESGEIIFRIGVDDAFELFVNGQSIIHFYGITSFSVFESSPVVVESGLVPIKINYAQGPGEANLVLSATGAGLPGGLIPTDFLLTAKPSKDSVRYYQSPRGDYSNMERNSDGTYTRTFLNGTQVFYDANGLQVSISTRNGNVTSYEYDEKQRLILVKDPVNLETKLAYEGDYLVSITDPINRVTKFMHDTHGNLIEITDPDNVSRKFSYDERHLLVEKQSKNNHVTVYNYNSLGQNIGALRPDASTVIINPVEGRSLTIRANSASTGDSPADVFQPKDSIAVLYNGNNEVTKITADRFGAVTSSENGMVQRTEITRDANSNPILVKRPNNSKMVMTYDSFGNLRTVLNEFTQYKTILSYHPTLNAVTSILDSNGKEATFVYHDQTGNLIETTDIGGIKTRYAYGDPNCPGSVTSIQGAVDKPEAYLMQYSYDARCNLSKVSDALNRTRTIQNDDAGNIVNVTLDNLPNQSTTFVYDNMNRLTQVNQPAGKSIKYEYDNENNLTLITDGRSQSQMFGYDKRNRLTSITDAHGETETFIYDGEGNVKSRTTRKGDEIRYEYDSANRLKKKIIADSDEVIYEYDSLGNLVSISDSDSKITSDYDDIGRLIFTSTEGSPNQPNISFSYSYFDDNRLKTASSSLGNVLTYGFNEQYALNSISTGNEIYSFTYDNLYRRIETDLPNGIVSTYEYDTAGQLKKLTNGILGNVISSFSYNSDEAGNRNGMDVVRQAFPDIARSRIEYGYDDLNRLTSADHPIADQPQEIFYYDEADNRLLKDGQSLNANYDSANRLNENGNYTFLYDKNGNLEQKTNKNTGRITDYTFDPENLLIRIISKGSVNDIPDNIIEYRYDALKRRIGKTVNGVETQYIYDTEDIVYEYTEGQLHKYYLHGPDVDEPLKAVQGEISTYYIKDGLGSISDLTSSDGSIHEAYLYNSFGNVVKKVGTIENPYMFTGREYDIESGLYYYRARYYDPSIGRFISEDPLNIAAGDANLYSYVFQNPINLTDPSGLETGRTPNSNREAVPRACNCHNYVNSGCTPKGPDFLCNIPVVGDICVFDTKPNLNGRTRVPTGNPLKPGDIIYWPAFIPQSPYFQADHSGIVAGHDRDNKPIIRQVDPHNNPGVVEHIPLDVMERIWGQNYGIWR